MTSQVTSQNSSKRSKATVFLHAKLQRNKAARYDTRNFITKYTWERIALLQSIHPSIFHLQDLQLLQLLSVHPLQRSTASATLSSPEKRPGSEPCTHASKRSRCPCRARGWMARCSSWTKGCPPRWAVPNVSEWQRVISCDWNPPTGSV